MLPHCTYYGAVYDFFALFDDDHSYMWILLLTRASTGKILNVIENACILTCEILCENYSERKYIIEVRLTQIPTLVASQNSLPLR